MTKAIVIKIFEVSISYRVGPSRKGAIVNSRRQKLDCDHQ